MPQVLGRKYEVFWHDNYISLMPQLRSKGLVAANIPFIMEASLEGIEKGNQDAMNDIVIPYKHSSDGLATPRQNSDFSGRFKFVPDSELLTEIKPDVKLINWVIPLGTDEAYANLNGVEFRRIIFDGQEYAVLASKAGNSGKYKHAKELYEAGATPIGRRLEIADFNGKWIHKVENSDLWLALAYYNFQESPNTPANQKAHNLLVKYHQGIVGETDRRYNDRDVMRVYLPEERSDQSHLRPWVVDSLYYRSYAYGNGDLGNSARLLGVEVRAEGAPEKFGNTQATLDERVQGALKQRQGFQYNGIIYVPVSDNSGITLK